MVREERVNRAKHAGGVAIACAIVLGGVGLGCSKSEDASKPSAPAPAEIPTIAISGTPRTALSAPSTDAAPGAARVEGKNFVVTAEAAPCVAGQECTMTVRLASGSGYHVNKQYPYKFVAAEAPGITFLGKPDASTFSRESGDFREENETTARMSVRFKPAGKGVANVAGTFKMSVCSDENCQIEQTPIALHVPVS